MAPLPLLALACKYPIRLLARTLLTFLTTSVALCGIYYWLWIIAIPKWRGYQVRQEIDQLDDSANTHRLVKVPIDQLPEWDRTHDPAGRLFDGTQVEDSRAIHGSRKDATIVDESKI